MRARHRPQVVDEVDRAGDRGREADAVVGAVDVVVHGLRQADDLDPLQVEAAGEGEGAVAADRHQGVEVEVAEHLEGGVGEVEPAVGELLVGAPAQVLGDALRLVSAGLIRELCRIVPPLRSIVRVLARVSGTSQEELSASWYGLTWRRAAQPRRSPSTSYPSSSIRQTNCWMAALSPGTSPPPVRMPTRFAIPCLQRPYSPPTAAMRSIRSTTRFE